MIHSLLTLINIQTIMSIRTKKCPKCKMEIPDDANICPYCRSRLLNSWGLPTADSLGFGSGGQQNGSSNSGCMVIIPLIVVAAYSIFYVISTC